MEYIFEALRAWGCDVAGAMERFLEDEDLYLACLEMVTEDDNLLKLKKALEEKQMAEAFDYAHTLKGVYANLGLTPMFDITVQIVEPLRMDSGEHLFTKYETLIEANEYLKQVLGK